MTDTPPNANDPYAEYLLDHEYDGIQEYDNPMPGWWVWIFVGSVLFCAPYIMWYHWGKGPSIHEQLEAENAAYAQALLATYGELEPDLPTLLRFMNDETAMTGQASVFKARCAQCHVADGSGSTGPNLTDDAWINVKAITDIPTVITEGVVAKGMPRWGDTLSRTEIVLLSAYVASLRGTPVQGGKAAQGNVIPPWPTSAPETSEAPEASNPAGDDAETP